MATFEDPLYPQSKSPQETCFLKNTRKKAADRQKPEADQQTRASADSESENTAPSIHVEINDSQSGPNYGIALSGGGIRSASFCLGALQQFERHNMLIGESKARYISSVSGGSYIAGALALIHKAGFYEEKPGATPGDPIGAPDPFSGRQPFAPGSPEEWYLRDHTRYLSHGTGGVLGVLWRLLMGIAWNAIVLVLSFAIVAVPLGWIYGAFMPSLRASHVSDSTAFVIQSYVWWVALIAALAGCVVGLVWIFRHWSGEKTRDGLLTISLSLMGVASGWLALLLGVPWILQAIHNHPSTHLSVGTLSAVSGGGVGLSGALGIAGAWIIRAGHIGYAKLTANERAAVAKRLPGLIRRLKMPLLNLLASLIGPVTVLAIVALSLRFGSSYVPRSASTIWMLYAELVGIASFILIWLFADITEWSAHPFYRERLSAAFVLKRYKKTGQTTWDATAVPAGTDSVLAAPRSYDSTYPVSEAQENNFPKLLICAAANISRYGTAPTGFRATSFVFSQEHIGGPTVGSWPAATFEGMLDGYPELQRNIAMPAAIAISGASVSPEMGKLTRAPLRFLMTMLNIRLGVWTPNPNRLDEFEARKGSRWHRRRMRPRVNYLFREMLGKNNPDAMFLYVSDGGHYENLGLIELLRRKCKYIWCVDASGEQQDNFSTIAGAVALAFSELGIRIDIDPSAAMAPDPVATAQRRALGLPMVVTSTFCYGTIRYTEGDRKDDGRLVIIKTGITEDAPQDVMDFYLSNKHFPCDSTLDQLYNAERFDAYRSLGAFAAGRAWEHMGMEFGAFLAGALDFSAPAISTMGPEPPPD